MKLEEEIGQEKFKSDHHKALVNVVFTANQLDQYSQRYLRKYDISPQQFNILKILREVKPNVATVTMLQSRMLDRMSNASRLVDKLKEKGLLIRNLNKDDRRKVDVKITAKGLKLIDKIEKSDFEDEYIKLSDAEAKKLNDLLDKLRA